MIELKHMRKEYRTVRKLTQKITVIFLTVAFMLTGSACGKADAKKIKQDDATAVSVQSSFEAWTAVSERNPATAETLTDGQALSAAPDWQAVFEDSFEHSVNERSRQNISNLDYTDNYILLEINPSFLIRPEQAEGKTVYIVEPNNQDAEDIFKNIASGQGSLQQGSLALNSLQSAVETVITMCRENGYEDKIKSDGVSFTIVQEKSEDVEDVSEQMVILAGELVEAVDNIELEGVRVHYYGSTVKDGKSIVNEYTVEEIQTGYEELIREYREEATRQLEDDIANGRDIYSNTIGDNGGNTGVDNDGNTGGDNGGSTGGGSAGNPGDNTGGNGGTRGWVDCPYCNGGMAACSQCSGNGVVTCDLCGGTGGETVAEEVATRAEYSQVCSGCGGSGQVQDAYHAEPGVCGRCQGTGVIVTIVDGVGTENVFHPCNRCDGNKIIRCNACEGSTVETCRYCGGDGGWYQ